MMSFEEKILSYLDGTLPEAEREEVLHAASVAPELRAMLDEHIRLGELVKAAQKPTSAPLPVQRDLAGEVPALAAMLPYLAGDVSRRRRRARARRRA